MSQTLAQFEQMVKDRIACLKQMKADRLQVKVAIIAPQQQSADSPHASDIGLQLPQSADATVQLDQGYVHQLSMSIGWQDSSGHRIQIPLRDGSILQIELADPQLQDYWRLKAAEDL